MKAERRTMAPGTARKPASRKRFSPQPSNFEGTLSHHDALPGPPETALMSLRRNDSSTAFLSHWLTFHLPLDSRTATRASPLSSNSSAWSTASRTSPLVAVEMPSRASNAELIVDSREARDIERSSRRFHVLRRAGRFVGTWRRRVKAHLGGPSARGRPDCTGNGPSDTVVAFLRIVQSIPRYERAGREARLHRVAHQVKPRKQSDMFLASGIRNHRLHLGMLLRGQNLRGVLLVHQDDIRSLRPERPYAAAHQFAEAGGLTAPGDVIGAELPDHKVRPVRQNITLDARDAAGNAVADPAAVDQVDLCIGHQSGQFLPHHRRIARSRIQDPQAHGRR